MKLLLLIFLAGLSLAASTNFLPHDINTNVQFYNDQEDFYETVVGAEEGDDFATHLRERFEEILEKIRDAIENRKSVGGNVVAKLREIYKKMKERSIPFGDKAKELLEQLKEKATGIWKRILDKINPSYVEARGTGAENLRDRLQELLETLKDSFKNKKLPGRGFLSKLRQIRDEMRQKKVPLGDKLREMIEKLKENTNGVWRRILDRFGNHSPMKSTEFGVLYEEPKTELGQILKKHLNEILDKIKDIIDSGKAYKEDLVLKAKEIAQKLKDIKVDIGDHARNTLKQLKEKAKDYWKKVLDKLSFDSEVNTQVYMGEANTELAKTLKKHLEDILEKIQDIIDNGKTYKEDLIIKAKEIAKKLKEMRVDIGDYARHLIKDFKEKATNYWKKILDKIIWLSETNNQVYMNDPKTELGQILKKHLEEILEKIKDIIDNGKTYKEDLVIKAKEIAQKLKDIKVDIGDHAKKVLKDLKEKAKDYWKKVLDKLSFDSEINTQVYMGEPKTELGKTLKKHLEEILEKIKDIVDNGKTYKEDLVIKAKEIAQKLKEMKVDVGEYARLIIKDLKEKAKDYWKKIWDKFSFDIESNEVYFGHTSKESNGVISDYFHKVKNYFKELNIELHEKYSQFGHWIKEQYEKNIEKGKDKAESLKQIAQQFLHDSRMMSKHIAVEAKFFFTEYSNELGDMFKDVMKKIDNVLKN